MIDTDPPDPTPVAVEGVTTPVPRTEANEQQQEQLRVFIVDDDEELRTVTRGLLEANGFIVRAATLPSDALRMYAQNPEKVVVTDVRMPEMNGRDLANALRNIRSDAQFVFVSGLLPDDVSLDELLARGIFVQKPFSMDMLIASVRKAFGLPLQP